MITHSSFRLPVVGLLAALLSPELPAQTAPASPASADDAEVPVELPPFEVRSEKDQGYLAQNTTSGSRLNTSLKDTPAPVSVFTQEFIMDIGATDIAELADYAISTERVNGIVGDVANGNEFSGPSASLRVRGLPSDRLVNFFARNGEVDTYNVERVELSRGPNALLFGLGGTGGVFNTTTKKADVRRTFYSATVRAGDYDAFRASVDLNQSIIHNKLALRINALDSEKASWRPHEHNDSERLAAALRWQITPRAQFNVEYETGTTDRSTHRLWAGFDSYTDWNNAGQQLDPKAPAPPLNLQQRRAALGITAYPVSTPAVTNHYWVWNATDGEIVNYSSPLAAHAQSRSANTSAPITPANPNPASGPQENPMLLDFSVVPRDVAIGGPGIGNLADQDVFTTSLTVEPIDNLFFELAFNRQELRSTGYDIGNTELRIQWDTSPTTVTGQPNPHAREPFIEILPNRRDQNISSNDLRLTSSYETPNFGKFLGRHRVSGMLERRTEETKNSNYIRKIVVNPPNTTAPEHAQNSLRYRTYVDLDGPVENIASADFREDPSGRSAWIRQQGTDVKRIIDSAMVAAQSHFLHDRLVGTIGYRTDYVKSYDSTLARGTPFGPFAQGENYPVRNATPNRTSGITRTQGVVAHVTNWLSLFYNTSSSFDLGNPNSRLVPGTPVPNPRGESDDVGLKLSLFDGKLFATVTYYETATTQDSGSLNAGVTNGGIDAIWDAVPDSVLASNGLSRNDPTVNVNFNSFSFDTASQGWEYDLVANPTPNWRVSFSFADRKTVQSNTAPELLAYIEQWRPVWTAPGVGELLTANGTSINDRLAGIDADHEIRIVRPNGLQRLGDSRYSATLRTNYSFREGFLKGFSVGGGARWRGDMPVGYTAALEPLEAKGYTLVDLTFGYNRRAQWFGRRVDLQFQLNLNNVLNENDLIASRLFDDGSMRTYRFQSVRDWFITMTARF
jgi:Outer membrane receptor for ferric coprogen and ferric-rhodotorulic acid